METNNYEYYYIKKNKLINIANSCDSYKQHQYKIT